MMRPVPEDDPLATGFSPESCVEDELGRVWMVTCEAVGYAMQIWTNEEFTPPWYLYVNIMRKGRFELSHVPHY